MGACLDVFQSACTVSVCVGVFSSMPMLLPDLTVFNTPLSTWENSPTPSLNHCHTHLNPFHQNRRRPLWHYCLARKRTVHVWINVTAKEEKWSTNVLTYCLSSTYTLINFLFLLDIKDLNMSLGQLELNVNTVRTAFWNYLERFSKHYTVCRSFPHPGLRKYIWYILVWLYSHMSCFLFLVLWLH